MTAPKMSTNHIKFREIVYHDISMYSVNFTNSAKCYGKKQHWIEATTKLISVIYIFPKASPPHTSDVVNCLWSGFMTETLRVVNILLPWFRHSSS